MKRKIEDKQETIKYESKNVSLDIYRNLLQKRVSISIWIQDKGSLTSLSKEAVLELYDLLKELKVDDLEID